MTGNFQKYTGLALVGASLLMSACADGGGSTQNGSAGSTAPATGTPGVLVAEPNPIQVCDGSGLGVTTIRRKGSAPGAAEIRLGSSTGKLFAAVGPEGSAVTGKWVTNGMPFFLVRGAETLGTVTVGVTRDGCP